MPLNFFLHWTWTVRSAAMFAVQTCEVDKAPETGEISGFRRDIEEICDLLGY
jgi:hypothetical protein